MTDPIVRSYETERQARDVVEKLRANGFREDMIFLVTPGLEGTAESGEVVSDAVRAGQALRAHAGVIAEGVRTGRSLVAVQAPFGAGLLAAEILDSEEPIDTGERRAPRRSPGWDEAAPLSSALRLRTLRHNQPAPFSSALGMHAISGGGRSFLSSMFRELTSPDFALFGRSALSNKAAPLSSIFGLRTINRAKTGASWRTSLGLPLLSKNPAPLSSALGLDLLTRDPLRRQNAPLSAVLGLPTISHGRTLSMFGELASSKLALFGRNSLIDGAAPLSSMTGLKTISGESGGSMKTSFGLPLLAEETPRSFGLPVLSRNSSPTFGSPLMAEQKPRSFGLPLLSRKPSPTFGSPLLAAQTPTSLGLPLLSRKAAPLSSLFGLPVLSASHR